MYVVTSEAASLLKISHKRLLELLRKGRVKGAYKSGRFWLIPLYKNLPHINPGKRGRKGNWKKIALPRKIIVHVNRNEIRDNEKRIPQEKKSVITVKTSSPVFLDKNNRKSKTFHTNNLEIPYPCRIIYRPEKPLKCGATLWIEIMGENIDKLQPPPNILGYDYSI